MLTKLKHENIVQFIGFERVSHRIRANTKNQKNMPCSRLWSLFDDRRKEPVFNRLGINAVCFREKGSVTKRRLAGRFSLTKNVKLFLNQLKTTSICALTL